MKEKKKDGKNLMENILMQAIKNKHFKSKRDDEDEEDDSLSY